jgi:hypothetical protein
MNKREELIYLAGLLDGEGHIRFFEAKNGRGVPYPTIAIVFVQGENNKGKEVCEWIKERFGGSITYQTGNEKRKGIYRWELRGVKAYQICLELKEFCQIKQRQLQEATIKYAVYKRF